MINERISEQIPEDKLFNPDCVPFLPHTTTLVTGYWDLVHYAHASFLRKCKNIGNPLVVGVISERTSIKPERPILHDNERAGMVSELASVDWVFIANSGYNYDLINHIKPKHIVFSSGEQNDPIKNAQIFFLQNTFPEINIISIPRQSNDISTSEILRRARSFQVPHGEILRANNIKKELLKYAENSNAKNKTAAFILTDSNIVVSRGCNYHPNISGEPIHYNSNTYEFVEGKPRPMHAELNAILKLYQRGYTNLSKFVMHSLNMPCAGCAEVISRSGIRKVIYYEDFDNNLGELVLKSNNITLIRA